MSNSSTLLPKQLKSMVGSGKQHLPGRVGVSTLIFKGPFCIGHKTLPKGKSILIGARIDARSSFRPRPLLHGSDFPSPLRPSAAEGSQPGTSRGRNPTQPPPLLALCARHCRTAPPRAWPALVVATLARCPRVVLHHWARRQLKRPDKATPRPVSALQAGARAQTGSACTRRCRGTMLKFSSASRGSQQSWIWARPMGEDAVLPFSPHCPLARSSPLCSSPQHSGMRLSLLWFSSSFFSTHPTTPSTNPSFIYLCVYRSVYLSLSPSL